MLLLAALAFASGVSVGWLLLAARVATETTRHVSPAMSVDAHALVNAIWWRLLPWPFPQVVARHRRSGTPRP